MTQVNFSGFGAAEGDALPERIYDGIHGGVLAIEAIRFERLTAAIVAAIMAYV